MDSKVTTWMPSRKWFVGLVTGLATITTHALASGGWDTTEWGELVALASSLAMAWLIPNPEDPAAQVHTVSKRGVV